MLFDDDKVLRFFRSFGTVLLAPFRNAKLVDERLQLIGVTMGNVLEVEIYTGDLFGQQGGSLAQLMDSPLHVGSEGGCICTPSRFDGDKLCL